MKLAKYLKKQKLKISHLATEFGVVHCVVRRWCIGEVIPDRKNMQKIFKWSNGEVTPNDFYFSANDNEDSDGGSPGAA